MAKIIEYKTLKKRIVRAISKGNHNTKYIIEAVKCELQYYDFCKAIEELRCDGIVSYSDELEDVALLTGYTKEHIYQLTSKPISLEKQEVNNRIINQTNNTL